MYFSAKTLKSPGTVKLEELEGEEAGGGLFLQLSPFSDTEYSREAPAG